MFWRSKLPGTRLRRCILHTALFLFGHAPNPSYPCTVYLKARGCRMLVWITAVRRLMHIQGYLAHKKTPTPLEDPPRNLGIGLR